MVVQGLIMMLGGFLILVYRPVLKDWFGTIAFAERYLGTGGTWTFLAILGFALFVIGLMWAMGTFQTLFFGLFGPIFGL